MAPAPHPGAVPAAPARGGLGGGASLPHIPRCAGAAVGLAHRFDASRSAMQSHHAKFTIGQVVKHRVHPFRGVIFDVDPEFANSEEWYQSIPEPMRPRRDQPFYHLLAENAESYYVAYVSEQNLLEDPAGGPVGHPQIGELFGKLEGGRYRPSYRYAN
jgi:heat shock protein HspQ